MLGGHLLDRFARFMRTLEKAGQLSRRIEYLPDDEEVLDRLRRGEGLSRAEIAVLPSYSKLVLYDQLLESNLPDAAYFATDLAAYFPQLLLTPYAAPLGRHPNGRAAGR